MTEKAPVNIVATYHQIASEQTTHLALGRLCSLQLSSKAAYQLKKVAKAVEKACNEIAMEWQEECKTRGFTFDKERSLEKGERTDEEYAAHRKALKDFDVTFKTQTKDLGLHKFPFEWFEANGIQLTASEIDSLDWLYMEPEAEDEGKRGKLRSV